MWKARDHPPIEPPPFKVMPGRPKRNKRKPRDESKKLGKFPRKGTKITCNKCKQQGHNKKGCKEILNSWNQVIFVQFFSLVGH